jgi:hypothetical protein
MAPSLSTPSDSIWASTLTLGITIRPTTPFLGRKVDASGDGVGIGEGMGFASGDGLGDA